MTGRFSRKSSRSGKEKSQEKVPSFYTDCTICNVWALIPYICTPSSNVVVQIASLKWLLQSIVPSPNDCDCHKENVLITAKKACLPRGSNVVSWAYWAQSGVFLFSRERHAIMISIFINLNWDQRNPIRKYRLTVVNCDMHTLCYCHCFIFEELMNGRTAQDISISRTTLTVIGDPRRAAVTRFLKLTPPFTSPSPKVATGTH